MKNKIVRYTLRTVCILLVLLFALVLWGALTPPMKEYQCESGNEDLSTLEILLMFFGSIVVTIVVWHFTKGKKEP